MWSDKLIRRAVWPENEVDPIAYVPEIREKRFGPIRLEQIQPVSLDVRLSHEFRTPEGHGIEVERWVDLAPGQCLLGSTVERFNMRPDNVAAQVEGKSSLARQFLTVHAAGLIDPGFLGDITLELKNDGLKTLRLIPGQKIAQVTFWFLAAPVDRPYGSEGLGSHYQFQSGPTASA